MPALASRSPTVAPENASQVAPQAAAQAPDAEQGTPDWLNQYNLQAGNGAALEALIGVGADGATADSLLEGDGIESEEADDLGAPDWSTEEDFPTDAAAPTDAPKAKAAAPPPPPAKGEQHTATHAPAGQLGKVYRKNEKDAKAMKLQLTPGQKNELAIFRANWEKNHGRYEAVAAKTGVPPKLIAAIHYREASLAWDTYLHQGDPLGKPAVHWPTHIPVFYKWEDAAVHALNMKKGLRDEMGMDETTDDPAALATYAEAYNGLGYYNHGKESPYAWGGTDQYHGGRYVKDGKFDPRSWDQRVGVMALMSGLDGADVGSAPAHSPHHPAKQDAWAAVLEGHDVLAAGSAGPAVTALQEKLGQHGHKVGVDGQFGAGTRNAVVAFQREHGLGADGEVGSATAHALDGSEAPAKHDEPVVDPDWTRVLSGGDVVREGDHGEVVRTVQEKLAKHGVDVDVDGDFGPATKKAVIAFQGKHGLPADGVVGHKTAKALDA